LSQSQTPALNFVARGNVFVSIQVKAKQSFEFFCVSAVTDCLFPTLSMSTFCKVSTFFGLLFKEYF